MLYTDLTRKALNFAYDAHHGQGQNDKSGVPYIFHPYHVAESLGNDATEEEIAVALLHDVVEDTDYTFEDLREAGFPDSVIEALVVLTHDEEKKKSAIDPEAEYLDYVREIKKNPIARKVKIQDLKHNMDVSRLISMYKDDELRLRKYEKALAILTEEE